MFVIGARRKHDVAFTNLCQDSIRSDRAALAQIGALKLPQRLGLEDAQKQEMCAILQAGIETTERHLAEMASRMPLFYRMQYYMWRVCNRLSMP